MYSGILKSLLATLLPQHIRICRNDLRKSTPFLPSGNVGVISEGLILLHHLVQVSPKDVTFPFSVLVFGQSGKTLQMPAEGS
jgi:hypothetical protein